MAFKGLTLQILTFACCWAVWAPTEAGIIKDLYQKITHTNNKTDQIVRESSPICGSEVLFSTADQSSLSPEFVFINNRPSAGNQRDEYKNPRDRERSSRRSQVNEVAKEFRFSVENVTLDELRSRGFNPDAPVTILMHGFTSGYPLQAWISAIVEAYTINRQYANDNYNGQQRQQRPTSEGKQLAHNLFVINCNYALRGIVYPRAVANLPIVASYVTRFINDKLLDEAGMDSKRIQLIGHSLGAHLAGFVGKNTRSPLGRIYGLDPAGPCFGTISGPLYPANKRLAPSDADQVITIHTNSALLGIDKPIGRYSVFVEGGANQPGCKDGGLFHSLGSTVWNGPDFDKISCSHSRAPNLLTYRHEQGDSQDDCQLVAYECKDWDSFVAGHCGLCQAQSSARDGPFSSLDCIRIGLDWQYPSKHSTSGSLHEQHSSSEQSNDHHKHDNHEHHLQDHGYHQHNDQADRSSSTRSPAVLEDHNYAAPHQHHDHLNEEISPNRRKQVQSTRKPSSSVQRDRRQTRNTSLEFSEPRRADDFVRTKSLYLRTSDTQPYCIYHYQVVLELNEPLSKKPAMSLVLQDSEPDSQGGHQSSISSDDFGNKFSDRFYTHLMTSSKKLHHIDHATLLIRSDLPEGRGALKALHVNYMSHADPQVRQRLSARLCPIDDGSRDRGSSSATRIYFEPCDSQANKDVNENTRSSRRPDRDLHGNSSHY